MMKKSAKTNSPVCRILAVMLSLVLTLCSLPLSAFAESSDDFIFDTYEAHSTYDEEDLLSDSFYYTDEWFDKDPKTRNDALALLSMQLTAAVVDADVESYGKAFLEKMGFAEYGCVAFHTEDPGDSGYLWAKKSIGDTTLILISVHNRSFDGAATKQHWTQNFTVNGSSAEGEHYALSLAAESTLEGIAALAGDGEVKYWIVGQSRGAAIADLIAAKLPAKLEVAGADNGGIFAYTFEAPAVVPANDLAGDYSYIHNYRCGDDVVTHIPMWGMTLYGNIYELRTEATEAGLQKELTKISSNAAGETFDDYEEQMIALINKLEARVSWGPKGQGDIDRADYSKQRSDVFTDLEGIERTVNYSYQNAFIDLMGSVFSGELSGLSMDVLTSYLEDLLPIVDSEAKAACLEVAGQYDEASPYFWDAALGLKALLSTVLSGKTLSVSDGNVYAILRVLGPIIIDTSYEATGSPFDAIMYAAPLIDIVPNVNSMIYSHHFDTLIARLKSLAPQPERDHIDIQISTAVSGDSASDAPSEVADYISSLDESWLSTESAAWNTEDETLQDGSIYQLTVTLKAVAHIAADDFSLTLNGEAPAGDIEITYEGGASYITATWEFTMGTPEEVTVSFVTGNGAESPAAITVSKGTMLRFEERPEFVSSYTEDGLTWLFDDWYDEDGNVWDDIRVNDNITVYASWIRVIDDIQVQFEVPKLGDPVPAVTVPEGAPYRVLEYNLSDDEYIAADEIYKEGYYHLNVFVTPNEGAVFALSPDEEGYDYYTGSASINGESTEGWYSFDPDYDTYPTVYVGYDFLVGEIKYEVVSGDGANWQKGSSESLDLTVKRSLYDDEIAEHFTGVKIDGKDLAEENYDIEYGSIIVKLKPEYLETLKAGSHSFEAEFDDADAAKASFAIVQEGEPEDSPSTGLFDRFFAWTAVLCLATAM